MRRGGPVERGDAETRRILQKFKLLCESSSLPNPPKVQTPMRILQPPGTRALVTSAGLPGGRSSLSGGLGREGFGGFNSRPHRTNNLHDLLFWRIRNRGVRVACSKAAWCSRGVREALSWRAQRPRGDVVAFSQAEWRSRGVLTGRAATTETTFLGDSCVRGFNDCPRFPGL